MKNLSLVAALLAIPFSYGMERQMERARRLSSSDNNQVLVLKITSNNKQKPSYKEPLDQIKLKQSISADMIPQRRTTEVEEQSNINQTESADALKKSHQCIVRARALSSDNLMFMQEENYYMNGKAIKK